jgi:hypothetical protein
MELVDMDAGACPPDKGVGMMRLFAGLDADASVCGNAIACHIGACGVASGGSDTIEEMPATCTSTGTCQCQ